MSAFMLIFSFFVVSAPIYDIKLVSHDIFYDLPNVTCSECLETMDQFKNETSIFSEMVDDIQYVCGQLYNVDHDECLNLTHDLKCGFNFINNHTSAMICQHLDYC